MTSQTNNKQCAKWQMKKVCAAAKAKKKSRKLCLSGVPFSGEIVKHWRHIEAWKLAVQRFHPRIIKRQGTKITMWCKIKRKFWKCTLANANIDAQDDRLVDLKQCQQELDRAWRQCNQERHKSSHHRATHIQRIATRRANKNETKAVNEIKTPQRQEDQWTQSRIMKCK